MDRRIPVLALALLCAACGQGTPDPSAVQPVEPLVDEGAWAAMVEVIDAETDAPITGAAVQVVALEGLTDEAPPELLAQGASDSSGRFTCGGLPPEACLIRVIADGYRPNSVAAHPPREGSNPMASLRLRLAPAD